MPCSGPGPRLRLDRAGGSGGPRRAGSPGPSRPRAPQRGRAGGFAGRVGPDAVPRWADRADPQCPARAQPARASDSPAWRRQNPSFAAAPGARPGPASRREAAPRRRLFCPPRSAPPAHFPQEMINSSSGAFPWQPAPTRRGAAVRVSTRSRTLSRALTLKRGAAHSATTHAPPRPSPGCPAPRARTRAPSPTGAYACSYLRARTHTSTQVPFTCSSTLEHIPTLVRTYILNLQYTHPQTLVLRNFHMH